MLSSRVFHRKPHLNDLNDMDSTPYDVVLGREGTIAPFGGREGTLII